jgi:antibiotic biosynthesis monooxygenase (ABM) superfamily enzyme
MELLYPVSSHPPRGEPAGGASVTVLVDRVIPKDQEAPFRSTLEELLEEFARVPGSSGSLVFRREAGVEVEFSILQHFATRKDHDAWLASAGFERWRAAMAPPTPTPGHVQRYSGMDAFFVDARAPDAPPRWKMAVVLLFAVYPMSLAVAHWLAPALARVSLFTGALITSVIMVVSMTWIVVPLLTKLFAPWLQPASPGRSR